MFNPIETEVDKKIACVCRNGRFYIWSTIVTRPVTSFFKPYVMYEYCQVAVCYTLIFMLVLLAPRGFN